MSFVSVKGISTVYAFNPAMASEERIVLVRAFWKGASFEMSVNEIEAKTITQVMPKMYIEDCLRKGKTLPGLKAYWKHELDKYHAIYSRLIETDPTKYIAEPMEVIIRDMFAESRKYEDSEVNLPKEDIMKWFCFKWFVGVGCMEKLGVIKPEDDDNGFTFLSGPKSLIEEYEKVVEEKTIAERDTMAGGDPSEP
jgi:hypothetical protein